MPKLDTSPWHYDSGPDENGRRVVADVHFDPATITRDPASGYPTGGGAIVNPGLSGTRDPGCAFTHVRYGADGRITAIPDGAFSVSRQTLRNQGYDTLFDVIASPGFTVQRGP